MDKAIAVCIDFRDPEFQSSVEELNRLISSAGADVVGSVSGRRQKPDPATYAGKGKVEELSELVRETCADVIIFNHAISPVQQRNIEKRTGCRTLDKTSLILDIFAQRARTHEGKVQVELAQLTHLSTRLVRGWTHLERQKGGIGLRGPGETQLETDRRLLSFRVKSLKEKLVTIRRQRETRRSSRGRSGVFKISLVGYTNAGKSTLFNRLTKASAYAANQLFATLETTTRRMAYIDSKEIVLSDTVGFVRDLPHSLVEAFKATLEETADADLLLHVVDASSSSMIAEHEEVQSVLKSIGADRVPQLTVMNKIDLTDLEAGIERAPCGRIGSVNLSSETGDGLKIFRSALPELIEHGPSDRSNETNSDGSSPLDQVFNNQF